MESVDDFGVNSKLERLTGTLDRTAKVLVTTDKLIDHYRELSKAKEWEIARLEEDLCRSKEESIKRYDVDYFNRYRKGKSHRESSESSSDCHHRHSSPIKKSKHFCSPKVKFKENSSSYPNFDVSPSKYFSTPKDKENMQEINYHLRRIHNQIEEDNQGGKNRDKEMESINRGMKSLKEIIQEPRYTKEPLGKVPFTDLHENSNSYERKMQKQQATIRMLAERLEKKEVDTMPFQSGVNYTAKSNQLALLEQQLNDEKSERMKIMKEYTDVQQRLSEADRERSELLYALSDVKAEARTILHAYEKSAQSVPELKSLLEQSAKQKSEFSEQVRHLQHKGKEYKELIIILKEKLSNYTSIINALESEKQRLNRKVEETESKYIDVNKELKTANQKLLEATQSFNDMEKSKQQLQDKALNTLKSYRSKCRKYEKDIQGYIEQYKIKEIELTKAISQSKELEIENLKQMHQFEDLSSRMEELQGSITMYVGKCHQVSDEKNELEMILSQTNDQRKKNYVIHKECQHIKDENSILKTELCDEKEKRVKFESLSSEYYENNMSLHKENLSLQLAVQKERNQLQEERNNHTEVVNKLKEHDTLYTQEDIKSNENLKKQLCQQQNQIDNEVEKSKDLTRKLRSLTNENKKIQGEYKMEKESFDEKLRSFESPELFNRKENAMLQENGDNRKMVISANKGDFKTIIDILNQDIDNLLNLLCHEEENSNPIQTLPEHTLTNNKVEVLELREKFQSCYSVTKTLKERYNQQKVLIKRARERIKSQIEDIQYYKYSQKKHNDEISVCETMQQRNLDHIAKMKNENIKLENRVNNLTKDLEECTRALHKSVELAKERETVLNEIEVLDSQHKERQKINENYIRATERIEVLTEQLSEAKVSFNELKQESMNKTNYADRMIQTFQSITPSKKPKLQHYQSYLTQNDSSLPSFRVNLENKYFPDTSQTKFASQKTC